MTNRRKPETTITPKRKGYKIRRKLIPALRKDKISLFLASREVKNITLIKIKIGQIVISIKIINGIKYSRMIVPASSMLSASCCTFSLISKTNENADYIKTVKLYDLSQSERLYLC